MSKTDLKAIVWKEGNWYVAKAIGVEVASQGKTKAKAIPMTINHLDSPFCQTL